MQIRVRPFLSGNRMDAAAGACVELSVAEAPPPLEPEAIWSWLQTLPSTFQIAFTTLNGTLHEVYSALLQALSEQARLEDQNEVRVLRREPRRWLFWLPIDDPQAAELTALLALQGVVASAAQPPDRTRSLQLWAQLEARGWNQTHRHLARAARRLRIPVRLVDRHDRRCLLLGHGAHQRQLLETLTDQTSALMSHRLDKLALHQHLAGRGIPLPKQRLVHRLDEALDAAAAFGWPVVLKPVSAGKGRGVWVGLQDPEALRQAWERNQDGAHGVMQLVQPVLPGVDHRLLVVNGTLLAAAQRHPAELVSDGRRCVADQLQALNQEPDRGKAYERLRNRVPVDARLENELRLQGWSLRCVPPSGTRIRLSRAANLSQGGHALDCTSAVHPDNRLLAEDVATLLGVDVLGLDLISADLSVSWREGNTWLLEANCSPGLRPHLLADPATDLCERLVQMWCGTDPLQTRIPVALVTGSIGKTTTARVLAHLLRATFGRVALASSTGTALNGERLMEGDAAGGGAAAHLLTDRRVQALVAEMARGNLIERGLGLDPVDGAIVTCIDDNHVGFDGIRTREEMARLKGRVAEAAERCVVLNADDPLVLAMAHDRPPEAIALVSCHPGSAAWHQHRQAKGLVALYETGADGWIRLQRGDDCLLHLRLSEIPAAQGGAVRAVAPAVAFASAQAVGLGSDPSRLRDQLLSFGHHPSHSEGRFEVLVQQPFELVLTWADGARAMASVSDYVLQRSQQQPFRCKRLLCSAPDKRSDAYLQAVGAATLGFDQVFCAAFAKREARPLEEVPRLLAAGVRSLGAEGPEAVVMGDEFAAVEVLIAALQPGDLAVVSCFDTATMRRTLLDACSVDRA